DLVRVGLLGCGGFGSVELWEHRDSKETYAMKCVSKGFIVKMGMQDSIINEKNILLMTNSFFIIKLLDPVKMWSQECFNGSQTLYFLMEPALGGELYATYNRKGLHGMLGGGEPSSADSDWTSIRPLSSEKHTKFYIAGTVCALAHLHERRIIYRDLKPENLLLSEGGQLKLTDMGLAKFVVGKTYTTCGTPDYFSPELIASSGHTIAVDWWTLGILLFELMAGHPPFESPTPMETYSKVMKGIGKVKMPPKCQGAIGDLIKGLLKKEPSERLPMRPGSTQNLKDHKRLGTCKKDLSNFTARKERAWARASWTCAEDDMPQQLEYEDDGSEWDKDFASRRQLASTSSIKSPTSPRSIDEPDTINTLKDGDVESLVQSLVQNQEEVIRKSHADLMSRLEGWLQSLDSSLEKQRMAELSFSPTLDHSSTFALSAHSHQLPEMYISEQQLPSEGEKAGGELMSPRRISENSVTSYDKAKQEGSKIELRKELHSQTMTPSYKRSFWQKLCPQSRLVHKWVKNLVASTHFEVFFGIVLVINSLYVGAQLQWMTTSGSSEMHPGFITTHIAFASLFTIECALQIFAFGLRSFLTGPSWAWNWLDILVVISSWIELILDLQNYSSTGSNTGQSASSRSSSSPGSCRACGPCASCAISAASGFWCTLCWMMPPNPWPGHCYCWR
ncbi:unnamed protein product, partial [Effrenium voratum]